MTRTLLIAALAFTAAPAFAADDGLLDRLENRIDRIESRRDERVDLSRADVIEDRIDRFEDFTDRRDLTGPRAERRLERRAVRWWVRHRH